MTISGNVPQHLVVGARTGFLAALPKIELPYQKIAEIISLSAASTGLVDIGAAPMPVESKGRTEVQDFIDRPTEDRGKSTRRDRSDAPSTDDFCHRG